MLQRLPDLLLHLRELVHAAVDAHALARVELAVRVALADALVVAGPARGSVTGRKHFAATDATIRL